MQFSKSSLILLSASRVVLLHGGDLGLAQGSAPGVSEEGLQEEALLPIPPPWPPVLMPPVPRDLWEPAAADRPEPRRLPLGLHTWKPFLARRPELSALESLPDLKLWLVRVQREEAIVPL